MNRPGPALLFIMLIICSCFFSGCSSLLSFGSNDDNAKKKVDVGFTIHNQTNTRQAFSFDEATSNLPSTLTIGESETIAPPGTPVHIQSISGIRLDEKGNAAGWNFVFLLDNKTALVTYDIRGITVRRWTGIYPDNEIILTTIITPGQLFEKNKERIFSTPGSADSETRDLALADGKYYLTISGDGKTSVLEFNANSGEMIASND